MATSKIFQDSPHVDTTIVKAGDAVVVSGKSFRPEARVEAATPEPKPVAKAAPKDDDKPKKEVKPAAQPGV